jgi:hypothetical protein
MNVPCLSSYTGILGDLDRASIAREDSMWLAIVLHNSRTMLRFAGDTPLCSAGLNQASPAKGECPYCNKPELCQPNFIAEPAMTLDGTSLWLIKPGGALSGNMFSPGVEMAVVMSEPQRPLTSDKGRGEHLPALEQSLSKGGLCA